MTTLQNLLNEEARLANQMAALRQERAKLRQKIIEIRPKNPPHCFGEDDCGTQMLVTCPYRWECGPHSY